MKHIISFLLVLTAALISYSVVGSITQIEQTPYQPFDLKKIQEQEEKKSKKEIRSAQKKLRDLGLYKGEIHGKIDVKTEEAIRTFQRERRLPMTGELSALTLESLKRAHDSQGIREERLKSWMYD